MTDTPLGLLYDFVSQAVWVDIMLIGFIGFILYYCFFLIRTRNLFAGIGAIWGFLVGSQVGFYLWAYVFVVSTFVVQNIDWLLPASFALIPAGSILGILVGSVLGNRYRKAIENKETAVKAVIYRRGQRLLIGSILFLLVLTGILGVRFLLAQKNETEYDQRQEIYSEIASTRHKIDYLDVNLDLDRLNFVVNYRTSGRLHGQYKIELEVVETIYGSVLHEAKKTVEIQMDNSEGFFVVPYSDIAQTYLSNVLKNNVSAGVLVEEDFIVNVTIEPLYQADELSESRDNLVDRKSVALPVNFVIERGGNIRFR